jgi:Tol biopolymer transport system component
MRIAIRGFLVPLVLALSAVALLASSAFAKPNEIAYTCEVDICLVDPDNPSAITNLTDNGSKTYDEEATWSPSGDRVAFVSREPTSTQNIFVMQPDAPGEAVNLGTQLTHYTENGSISEVLWSPDGTKIAYEREFGGGRSISVVAADGSTLTPLPIANPGEHPSWAPDGGKIAFSKGSEQVYTTNADGSNAIAPVPNAKGHDPAWAPGGTLIAYEALSPLGFLRQDVQIANYSGGTPVVLPAQQSDGAFPTWSPSGERIAYRVREEGDVDVLHVANANGTGDVPLPGLTNVRVYNYGLSWSPDGSRITFEGYKYDPGGVEPGTFAVYVANTSGSGAMVPITSSERNLEPDWRPDPLRTPFVPIVTPSGGRAGLPPGGRKPKIVWFTKRIPITASAPIHMMSVGCGAPDCGASTRGSSPKSSMAAGLRFRPATSSKKKPKMIVVGAGKLKLREGQSKTLSMYLNKAGKALLEKQGKLDIQATVKITSTGQPTVTAKKTIHVVLAKKKTKKQR